MAQKQIDRRNDPAVQKAMLLQKAKQGSNVGKVVSAIVGLTTIAVVTNGAIRAKKEEPPQPHVGSKKQIDIARAVGDLPPNVRERVMNDSNIVPRTLKDLRKP